MKERNSHTLRQALDRLPTYQPRPGSWEEIDGRLSAKPNETQREALARGLRGLPAYRPRTHLWARIETQLAHTGMSAAYHRAAVFVGLLVAAAALLVLLRQDTPIQPPVSERQVTMPESPLPLEARYTDWEATIDSLRQAFAASPRAMQDSLADIWQPFAAQLALRDSLRADSSAAAAIRLHDTENRLRAQAYQLRAILRKP